MRVVQYVKNIPGQNTVIQPLLLNGKSFSFEVDSGAKDYFCTTKIWTRLGRPALKPAKIDYVSATGIPIPVLGTF